MLPGTAAETGAPTQLCYNVTVALAADLMTGKGPMLKSSVFPRSARCRRICAALLGVAPSLSGLALAQAPQATPSPVASSIVLTLPQNFSPWGMFMSADIVVKAVMVGLVFASVLTWTIWFAKAIELLLARHRMRAAIATLGKARTFTDAVTRMGGGDGGIAALLREAETELRLSAGAIDSGGVKERIASRLGAGRGRGRAADDPRHRILATVGATAPFVGLFGTVWGIMNSFIGISKAHTTNLAVVAPGIAEALLATALGLVAAIPAVVMYNMFSRWIAGYRALHADAAAEILRLVSRDLDRGVFGSVDAMSRRPAAAAE